MFNDSSWDWDTGRRLISDTNQWKAMIDWLEEPYVSPDGEKIAAVVRTEEGAYSVCQNGTVWEKTFDKVWYLRFAPDNRLTALVSDMGEWTVAVDGYVWDNTFDFVWDTRFGPEGKDIIVAAQKGMKYIVVTSDMSWENEFSNLSNLTISRDGKRAAIVVQTVPLKEGEIFKFQEGCYSVAVDGKVWNNNFVNVWEMDFSHDGIHVAAEVRTTLYDYTIAVD
jgi:predicted heme/steroid binding protein